MSEHLLIGLAGVLVLGIGAQWLAWRLRLPSILMLLLVGLIAGPLTHFIEPDKLFGDLLFPLISLSVAVILFEGGLTLRLSELPKSGKVIFRLISVGALITWLFATLAARYILSLDWVLSILLGAILIVTGPTVVGPLLQQIRPRGQAGSILKWEGILIDPVGALLAVLVFEAILEGELTHAPNLIASGVFLTVIIGVLLSVVGAGLLIIMIYRYWIPDHLQNGIALLTALAAFVASNELQAESGLLTVTLMGIILANQNWISIKHIVEFKENLRVLLIGSLFVLLTSRLQLDDLLGVGWQGLVFVAALIVVVRPLAVIISTWRSDLTRNERLFLTWLAPRGIVAASVASIFAFELIAVGHTGAEKLISITFLVILGTVAFYGLTAGIAARRLGLSEQNPQGVLFVGAQPLARSLAQALQNLGFRVAMIDTNEKNVFTGQMEGLTMYYGSALAEELSHDIELTGIGRLLAMTSNNEVNSLAAMHYIEHFGRKEVYQLSLQNAEKRAESRHQTPMHLCGRCLFDPAMTYTELNQLHEDGHIVKTTAITETFTYDDFQAYYEQKAVPLILVAEQNTLLLYTTNQQPVPKPGQTLISLAPPINGLN